MASERAKAASLHYVDYGSTLKEHERLASELQQLSSENAELQLTSPISGLVITPRVQDRLGSYVTEGQEILKVADLSAMRARIYISEYDLFRVQDSALATLEVGGTLKKWRAQTVSIAPKPTEMDPNLQGSSNLKGTNPPHFYFVDLLVPNPDSTLKPGMTGMHASTASIGAHLVQLGGGILIFWDANSGKSFGSELYFQLRAAEDFVCAIAKMEKAAMLSAAFSEQLKRN